MFVEMLDYVFISFVFLFGYNLLKIYSRAQYSCCFGIGDRAPILARHLNQTLKLLELD